MKKNGLLITEAARVLGLHPETLRRWNRKGWLKSRRNYLGYRVFDRQEVLKIKERLEALRDSSQRKKTEAHFLYEPGNNGKTAFAITANDKIED